MLESAFSSVPFGTGGALTKIAFTAWLPVELFVATSLTVAWNIGTCKFNKKYAAMPTINGVKMMKISFDLSARPSRRRSISSLDRGWRVLGMLTMVSIGTNI